MKERPILFSAPMVRAILEGRKTQTRRVVKPQPSDWAEVFQPAPVDLPDGTYGSAGKWVQSTRDGNIIHGMVGCPYGKPGDRLWVRENFWQYGRYAITGGTTKSGKPEVTFCHEYDLTFRAEVSGVIFHPPKEKPQSRFDLGFHSRPSIFLERKYARIDLEITAVRVERLQDISEDDARAEGAFLKRCQCSDTPKSIIGIPFNQTWCHIHGEEFKHLWQSINGAESWEANPWLWVVEFERVKPAQAGVA